MTSNINYTGIDEQYPVAGQDNDSQGFRDNFSSIKSGLATAKSEITELQGNAVLTASLTNGNPVVNDLQGSSINNGYYNNFHGISHIASVSSATNIDVSIASVHVYTLVSDVSFTFTNWPTSGYFAKVRVHFVSNGSGNYRPGLFSAGGGVIRADDNMPSPLTANSSGDHVVLEAWSYNHGATVFVKYLGTY